VKAKEIRSSSYNPGNFYDTVLFTIDATGAYNYAVQITNRDSAINMYSASSGLIFLNNYHYFAGWSAGY
jgi:hypothetical protein